MSDEWAIPTASVPERKQVICPDCYRERGVTAPLLLSFSPAPDAVYYLPDGTRVGWADPGERLHCLGCTWSCARSEIRPELLPDWEATVDE
jgi:hypothetical protein